MWVTVGKVLGKEATLGTELEETVEGEGDGTGGTGGSGGTGGTEWCAYRAWL